jgi:hypothetical protein
LARSSWSFVAGFAGALRRRGGLEPVWWNMAAGAAVIDVVAAFTGCFGRVDLAGLGDLVDVTMTSYIVPRSGAVPEGLVHAKPSKLRSAQDRRGICTPHR